MYTKDNKLETDIKPFNLTEKENPYFLKEEINSVVINF